MQHQAIFCCRLIIAIIHWANALKISCIHTLADYITYRSLILAAHRPIYRPGWCCSLPVRPEQAPLYNWKKVRWYLPSHSFVNCAGTMIVSLANIEDIINKFNSSSTNQSRVRIKRDILRPVCVIKLFACRVRMDVLVCSHRILVNHWI